MSRRRDESGLSTLEWLGLIGIIITIIANKLPIAERKKAVRLGLILAMVFRVVLLALVASVPFWYSAIPIFIWDRDMGFREKTVVYWVFVWGMWPVFGVIESAYCVARLLD